MYIQISGKLGTECRTRTRLCLGRSASCTLASCKQASDAWTKQGSLQVPSAVNGVAHEQALRFASWAAYESSRRQSNHCLRRKE